MGRGRLLVGVGVAVLVGLVAAVVVARARNQSDDGLYSATGERRPNILVVMTDDQTLESVRVMDNLKSELMAEGTVFGNYYVSFPNCCPSRASYLSGQYSHNTGVEDNVAPLGGFSAFDGSTSLAVGLQQAGYYTAHVGKYLNGWGSDGDITSPPGWDRWFGLIDPTTYQYYGYSVSVDGEEVTYGDEEGDYQTDVLGAEAVDTIRQRSGTDQPWFLELTTLAPHSETAEGATDRGTGGSTGTTAPSEGGEDGEGTFRWAAPKPALRHEGTMAAKAPRGPAFDVVDPGKPAFYQDLPPLNEGLQRLIDQGYQKELQTLLAVDEWLGTIVSTLEETDQLDDTVIIFTSDNGFFHGEHRLAFQKFHLYEPSVHVPLVIRGGPFAAGARVEDVAANIDLAPTIYALAGVDPVVEPDGVDLAALAAGSSGAQDRAILLENKAAGGSVHAEAIHTGRYVLIQHETGEVELYDLRDDPDQLVNLADDPGAASLQANLQAHLDELVTCAGDSCRAPMG